MYAYIGTYVHICIYVYTYTQIWFLSSFFIHHFNCGCCFFFSLFHNFWLMYEWQVSSLYIMRHNRRNGKYLGKTKNTIQLWFNFEELKINTSTESLSSNANATTRVSHTYSLHSFFIFLFFFIFLSFFSSFNKSFACGSCVSLLILFST